MRPPPDLPEGRRLSLETRELIDRKKGGTIDTYFQSPPPPRGEEIIPGDEGVD
jgi:hypothetical protein